MSKKETPSVTRQVEHQPAPATTAPLDRHWHLAQDAKETAVTDLEHSLFRVMAAFDRWQSECLAAVAHKPLSSTDNAVLHIVRMKERPKTITEIARFLGRDDLSNLQYSLKKLTAARLVEKRPAKKRRGVEYAVTDHGMEVTEHFAQLRRALLIQMVPEEADSEVQFDRARRLLNLLQGVYDQAAVYVVSHSTPAEDD